MEVDLKKHSKELRDVLSDMDDFHGKIEKVAQKMRATFEDGGIVYVAGNGGSATLAQHLSDEMVGRYSKDRRPYPVVALTADSAVLTCIGNDYGYENIFSRQIEGLGKEGDMFVGYSTSGASKNIIKAAEVARKQGMTVISFTGSRGELKDMADVAVISPGKGSARIQELDLHGLHLLCEFFEED